MADPKPFASLSSGLLARKGAAMPAMRRQLMNVTGMHGAAAHDLHAHDLHAHDPQAQDDLGWNDMGEDAPRQSDPLAVVGLTPMPQHATTPPAEPPVVEQRRALAERVANPVQPEAAMITKTPVATAPVGATPEPAPVAKQTRARAPASARTAKAAFTLRLDPDRHLKLRLACAVDHRSAQQIVTQALDAYLSGHPQIAALADQLPRPTGAKSK